MIRPKALYAGARVALLAPSGPVQEEKIDAAIENIRKLSLMPVVFGSCFAKHGYLAGDDNLRAGDLNAAFADPSIIGILCARGGYGANRILPLLDLPMIANNPKVFCGYSDITAFHIVFNQICGFETYHTPMPATDLIEGLDEYSMYFYKKILFSEVLGELHNHKGQTLETLVGGIADGRLVGGNLTLVADSLGTPYEIDTNGKVLFLEDIGENIYRIDGMLTHLKNAGKLSQCNGIILGKWTNCKNARENEALSLRKVFEEIIMPEGKPCIMNVSCGHLMPSMSLPLGSFIRLDASRKSINVIA